MKLRDTPERSVDEIEMLDRQKYAIGKVAGVGIKAVSVGPDASGVMPVYCDAPTVRCAYCGTLGGGVRCDSCGAPR